MAKGKESHAEIEWAEAEVSGGTLTVPLAGEPSKAWAGRVAEVADRLEGGSGVKVTTKAITVEGVEPGAEGDVRHLLESAVMQANADFAPEEEREADDERSEADAESTAAFRAFAPGDD